MDSSLHLGLLVLGAIVAGIFWVRFAPRGLVWSIIAALISLSVSTFAIKFHDHHSATIESAAWICAGLSVVWNAITFLIYRIRSTIHTHHNHEISAHQIPDEHGNPPAPKINEMHDAVSAASIASMATGLGAAIIVLTILTMRIIYFVLTFYGNPDQHTHGRYGFHIYGLGIMGLLGISTILSAIRTKKRMFITVLFLIVTVSIVWAGMLITGDPTHQSRYGEHDMLFIISMSMTLLVVVTTIADGAIVRGQRWRSALRGTSEPSLHMIAPGLSTAVGVVAIGILLSGCYHILVPAWTTPDGYRRTLIGVFAMLLSCGCSMLFLAARQWNRNVSDIGMVLISVSFGALCVVIVPNHGVMWADRYPVTFNALILGFSVSALFWAWMSCVWRQQLKHDQPWTTTGRMIPYAEHISFMTALMALLVSVMMAVWPRLPRIANTDDSFGRIIAGIGGNLFLLWVVLWSGRRIKRTTFQALAGLVLISMMGFVAIRAMPFMSQ